MGNSNEPAKLPLSLVYCHVAKGKYNPHIHPSEADNTPIPCKDTDIGSITCKTKNQNAFIDDVDGLNLETVKAAPPSSPIILPNYIPNIDRAFFDSRSDGFGFDTVIISIEDLFTSLPKTGACIRIRDWSSWDEKLLNKPFFKNKKVILSLSDPDFIIESLWSDSDVIDFFPRLAKMGFYAVTGFNFSLFGLECALGHALNNKKSLVSFAELQRVGIPAIPHIYWLNDFQLIRWSDWLKRNPAVKLVMINCQCYETKDYPLIQAGLRFLIEGTKGKVKFLLEGPHLRMLAGMLDLAPFVHIAKKRPSMAAMNRMKYSVLGYRLEVEFNQKLPKNRLLEWNHQMYSELLDTRFFKNPLLDNIRPPTKRSIVKTVSLDKAKINIFD